MRHYYFSNLTNFYFKQLFFATYLSEQHVKRFFNRPFLTRIYPTNFWYLYYNFHGALKVYLTLLDQRQQIFFAGTMEMVKYDYQFFRFANYSFTARGDSREYTTQMYTLTRRPYLTLFGQLKHSAGLLINASSNLGPITKNVRKTGNLCISVMTPQNTLTDYLLTTFPCRAATAEHIVLSFFESAALSKAAITQTTQQFLLQLHNRTGSF